MSNAAALRPTAPRRGQARLVRDGCYVYGVVPAGTPAPAPEATLLTRDEIAALVTQPSARPVSRTRRALLTHVELLDRASATVPVLPMRFGTVLPSERAVEEELLAPYHDAFVAALAALTGRAQFTVRARYLSEAVLREVLEREPRARHLHERLHDGSGSDFADRVRFGEMVAHALMAIREVDAAFLEGTLRQYAVLTVVRVPPAVEGYRVADAAFLVERERRAPFEEAVEELAGQWRHRARLRLIGPMAAYDFADQLIHSPAGG